MSRTSGWSERAGPDVVESQRVRIGSARAGRLGMTAEQVWRLTLEPFGAHVAWSLLHAVGGRPALAVAGGVVRDTQHVATSTLAIAPQTTEGWIDVRGNVLVDPVLEHATAKLLGARLLPAELRNALKRDGDVTPTLEIAARGWPANVPWEAVCVDDSTNLRLVERATLVSAMSPGIEARRARLAPAVEPSAAGLVIVDPGPADDAYAGRLPPELTGAGGIAAVDTVAPSNVTTSAAAAGQTLARKQWSRLLYVGDVAAGKTEEPDAAALVFQRHGIRDPLTAGAWLADPERWPAPPRVALIGCGSESAVFTGSGGLPVAAVNAGAQLVTCTRWTLPADRLHSADLPATQLVLAVHRAHCSPRPLTNLRSWQLDRLAAWKAVPSVETSPLYWAALTSYVMPADDRD